MRLRKLCAVSGRGARLIDPVIIAPRVGRWSWSRGSFPSVGLFLTVRLTEVKLWLKTSPEPKGLFGGSILSVQNYNVNTDDRTQYGVSRASGARVV